MDSLSILKIKFRYFVFILAIGQAILIQSSCASYKYSRYDFIENNTVKIYSDNVQDFVAQCGSDIKRCTNGNLNYVITPLKKTNTIQLTHPNFEPQTLTVKRTVRLNALTKDILLSPFTFGIPLIVDVFKSDFYKVKKSNKNFTIHFEYKQSFMRDEFYKISSSTEPAEYTTWLNKYPKSDIRTKVFRHRDSIEFNIALNQKSESAIDNFIKTHQSSHFLSKANSIKAEMVAARLMFQEAKNANTVESFENFLAKYPQSLHTYDAYERLIDAAELRAFNKNTIYEIKSYVEKYLIKYATYISTAELDKKKSRFSDAIDILIVSNNIKTQDKSIYTEYSALWKDYNAIKNDLSSDYLKELSRTKNYFTPICNLLFGLMQKNKSLADQENFLNKVRLDFPNLMYENPYKNEMWLIIQKQKNCTGTVRMFNDDFLHAIVTNKNNSKRFSGREFYNYQDILADIDYSDVSYTDGIFQGIHIAYKNKKKLWMLDNSRNYEWVFTYFDANGAKEKTMTYTSETDFYEYDWENEINTSLKYLDDVIREAKIKGSKGEIYDALTITRSARDNNYPEDLLQNRQLDELIRKLEDNY